MKTPYYKVRVLTESKKPTGQISDMTIIEWKFSECSKACIQYEYLTDIFIRMKNVGSIELNRVESSARSCVYMHPVKRFEQK